jgi:hypothetical protein
VVRGAWCVFSTSGLPGGGENLLPPFGGGLSQGLALKPLLKFILGHIRIFWLSPITDRQ